MARLDELERKFEENPRRYFAPLANEYRKAGEARRAADLCRSQLPDVPGHISGHIVLGQALYDARDFDGSRAALETALALDPENIVALRYLGDIARDTGDAAEAERWYSRTLEADPYNEAATTALEVLRSVPAATSQPADEIVAESAAVRVETNSLAVGFEPTSHVEQPSESVDPPLIAEAASFVEIADAAPAESAPETVFEAPLEPAVTDIQEQVDSGVEAVGGSEPAAAALAQAPDETAAQTELASEASAGEPVEPVTEVPPETDVAVPTEASSVVAAPEADEGVLEANEAALEADEAAQAADEAAPAAAGNESSPSDVLTVTGEFEGDLSVSAAPETAEIANDEPAAQSETTKVASDELVAAEHAADDQFVDVPIADVQIADEPVADELVADEPPPAEPAEERFDVAAHAAPEPEPPEEAMQSEERVLESAAPFVTETMADLYLEQGYPHEALELLLQLSEQRPQDEQLRAKIEHIESVIVARRDAAVAAARAERAEMAEAAPLHAALAEIDLSAFAPTEPEPEQDEGISVQELFARMDRSRPRTASTVTPRPISRRRSDFVPLPEGESAASPASDDPFAFPNPPAPAVPRVSGPHETFNPSTADTADFNAWLRGLRGP